MLNSLFDRKPQKINMDKLICTQNDILTFTTDPDEIERASTTNPLSYTTNTPLRDQDLPNNKAAGHS
ncbi:hypothetical protein RhiirA5_437905 [Rhizophagus irregularis]|uniref:Uncharacterized protein n=1 Tax=Rhizophagus irregularis TaxID=588596 RepID=A0A2N0NJX1_9GLOM|nr:hypothetical protein RhiirA5_437905 [Rhizophagus irregularis]